MDVTYTNGDTEHIGDIYEFAFIAHFMIITFSDMKTRRVIPVADMSEYVYKGQPLVKAKKTVKTK